MRRKLTALGLAVTVILMLAVLAGCKGKPLPDGMDEETVLSAGEAVLDLIQAGDYEQVYGQMREDVREDVTAQEIGDYVLQATAEAGQFQKVDKTLVTGAQEPEPHGIAVFLCEYSDQTIRFRIAFDPEMELMGLEVLEQ